MHGWAVLAGVLAFAGVLGLWALAARSGRAKGMLAAAEEEKRTLAAARAELQATRARAEEMARALAELQAEDHRKEEILDNLERENEWLQEELEKRPKVTRRVYRILTLGISGTGKTALTLKWANPLFDLGMLKGTKIERYERTVSHVISKDVTTEHVFEVGDWGGEHIVDALQEAITEEIHGMLIVVDLTAPPPPAGTVLKAAKAVDPERIAQQLKELQPEVLKFFFGPKTLASCKTVVLFINKSDVIAGTPGDVERVACAHYDRLIKDLQRYATQIDVRVLVGSAFSGHSTHHLFAHFVDRILPKNAYDAQLLQRMMSDGATEESENAPRE
ncbi:MAG: hypothetical protein R3B70_34950 [Polyangiaceae bacterium]